MDLAKIIEEYKGIADNKKAALYILKQFQGGCSVHSLNKKYVGLVMADDDGFAYDPINKEWYFLDPENKCIHDFEPEQGKYHLFERQGSKIPDEERMQIHNLEEIKTNVLVEAQKYYGGSISSEDLGKCYAAIVKQAEDMKTEALK